MTAGTDGEVATDDQKTAFPNGESISPLSINGIPADINISSLRAFSAPAFGPPVKQLTREDLVTINQVIAKYAKRLNQFATQLWTGDERYQTLANELHQHVIFLQLKLANKNIDEASKIAAVQELLHEFDRVTVECREVGVNENSGFRFGKISLASILEEFKQHDAVPINILLLKFEKNHVDYDMVHNLAVACDFIEKLKDTKLNTQTISEFEKDSNLNGAADVGLLIAKYIKKFPLAFLYPGRDEDVDYAEFLLAGREVEDSYEATFSSEEINNAKQVIQTVKAYHPDGKAAQLLHLKFTPAQLSNSKEVIRRLKEYYPDNSEIAELEREFRQWDSTALVGELKRKYPGEYLPALNLIHQECAALYTEFLELFKPLHPGVWLPTAYKIYQLLEMAAAVTFKTITDAAQASPKEDITKAVNLRKFAQLHVADLRQNLSQIKPLTVKDLQTSMPEEEAYYYDIEYALFKMMETVKSIETSAELDTQAKKRLQQLYVRAISLEPNKAIDQHLVASPHLNEKYIANMNHLVKRSRLLAIYEFCYYYQHVKLGASFQDTIRQQVANQTTYVLGLAKKIDTKDTIHNEFQDQKEFENISAVLSQQLQVLTKLKNQFWQQDASFAALAETLAGFKKAIDAKHTLTGEQVKFKRILDEDQMRLSGVVKFKKVIDEEAVHIMQRLAAVDEVLELYESYIRAQEDLTLTDEVLELYEAYIQAHNLSPWEGVSEEAIKLYEAEIGPRENLTLTLKLYETYIHAQENSNQTKADLKSKPALTITVPTSLKDVLINYHVYAKPLITKSLQNITARLTPVDKLNFAYQSNFRRIYYLLCPYAGTYLNDFIVRQNETELVDIARTLMKDLTTRSKIIKYNYEPGADISKCLEQAENAKADFNKAIESYMRVVYRQELPSQRSYPYAIKEELCDSIRKLAKGLMTPDFYPQKIISDIFAGKLATLTPVVHLMWLNGDTAANDVKDELIKVLVLMLDSHFTTPPPETTSEQIKQWEDERNVQIKLQIVRHIKASYPKLRFPKLTLKEDATDLEKLAHDAKVEQQALATKQRSSARALMAKTLYTKISEFFPAINYRTKTLVKIEEEIAKFLAGGCKEDLIEAALQVSPMSSLMFAQHQERKQIKAQLDRYSANKSSVEDCIDNIIGVKGSHDPETFADYIEDASSKYDEDIAYAEGVVVRDFLVRASNSDSDLTTLGGILLHFKQESEALLESFIATVQWQQAPQPSARDEVIRYLKAHVSTLPEQAGLAGLSAMQLMRTQSSESGWSSLNGILPSAGVFTAQQTQEEEMKVESNRLTVTEALGRVVMQLPISNLFPARQPETSEAPLKRNGSSNSLAHGMFKAATINGGSSLPQPVTFQEPKHPELAKTASTTSPKHSFQMFSPVRSSPNGKIPSPLQLDQTQPAIITVSPLRYGMNGATSNG